mgnify:CR=1 FL=1
MNAGAFQITVLVVFAIMSAVLFAVFYAVARQSRRNVADEAVTETGYRLRRYLPAFPAPPLGRGPGRSSPSGCSARWSCRRSRCPIPTRPRRAPR